jgi:hypothetical protein
MAIRKKRYPVTMSGTELTPEVTDAMAKEAEEGFDPADFRPRPFDGSSLRVKGRFRRIRLKWLRGRDEEARWKVEDGVQLVRDRARELRRRHAKA